MTRILQIEVLQYEVFLSLRFVHLPIEWISGIRRHDAEQWNLTTNQKDEQGYSGP